MIEYTATLSDALTPITLISGIGLLLVSMSGRYSHATNRIRQLLAERTALAPAMDEELETAIALIFLRAKLLKNAILAVTLSAAFSSLRVLVTILEHLFTVELSTWKSTMLLTSVIFIVISSVIYVREVQLSLKALGLTVHHHNRS